jgi:Flp pilus assembly protein TadG
MMLGFLRTKIRNFARNNSGVAAVEFAFIAPVLAAAMVLTLDVGRMILDRTDMQSAVRAGAQYLMNGGQDLSYAQDLVMAAWQKRPEGGYVVSERFCMCGELVHACNDLCGDASIPDSYVRLEAIATLEGLITDHEQGTEEVVRIR